MKNSAWYHKLWLNKLNELPLKENADAAWKGMEQLLDQQLPVGNSPSGTPSPKPAGTTLGTYFSYIISAAAMVGIGAYFTLRTPEQSKINKVAKDKNVVQSTTDTLVPDTLIAELPSLDNTGIGRLNGNRLPERNYQALTLKQGLNVEKGSALNSSRVDGIVVSDTSKTTASDSLISEKIVNTQPANENSVPAAIAQQTFPARQLPADLSNDDGLTKQQEKQKKHQKRSPKIKTPIETPPYNYGLEAGVSHAEDEKTFYIGISGIYALSPRWLISTGLRMNTARTFTGKYQRESYFRPDSMPAFSFTDKRKVLALDIPLTITYKLSNTISVNAGPAISLPLKQLGIKLGNINQKTDTLMHTKVVYDILNNTKMNRINIGFSTGISLHFSQFDINTRYQFLSPYRFSNEFGDNKFKYRSFQIGIGYRFK
ncbi:MAG: hypothetical protein EOO88_29125 [Pedobacter sp.]|nr:MAG: hypothetical protein EOO88_29125 [Pedobacter sp.]